MSIQDWGAIGELAGSLFVLFTLFYLVLQVRANTQSNQLSMFESLTKDINDINMRDRQGPGPCPRVANRQRTSGDAQRT